MQVLGLGWLAEVVPYLVPLIILSGKWKATVLLTKITRLTTGLPGRRRLVSAKNWKANSADIPHVHVGGGGRKSTKGKVPL
jgi:hypothetical protein